MSVSILCVMFWSLCVCGVWERGMWNVNLYLCTHVMTLSNVDELIGGVDCDTSGCQ